MKVSSSRAEWTFPEFIFTHFRYELYCAGIEPYQRKVACDMFNSYQHKLEESIMPQKKQNNGNNGQSWNKVEFVNINLSNGEKKQFKSWFEENHTAIPELAAAMTGQGYKLSIKWDNGNSCFIATVTCDDESLDNNGKALSSRSNDWMEAIALNIFKTDVVCEDGKWGEGTRGNSWG